MAQEVPRPPKAQALLDHATANGWLPGFANGTAIHQQRGQDRNSTKPIETTVRLRSADGALFVQAQWIDGWNKSTMLVDYRTRYTAAYPDNVVRNVASLIRAMDAAVSQGGLQTGRGPIPT